MTDWGSIDWRFRHMRLKLIQVLIRCCTETTSACGLTNLAEPTHKRSAPRHLDGSTFVDNLQNKVGMRLLGATHK